MWDKIKAGVVMGAAFVLMVGLAYGVKELLVHLWVDHANHHAVVNFIQQVQQAQSAKPQPVVTPAPATGAK